jgi:hypothetical protein
MSGMTCGGKSERLAASDAKANPTGSAGGLLLVARVIA